MVGINENLYSARGEDGRDHIPAMPFWIAIIRAFQLLFAIIVLALCAYAGSVLGFTFWEGYSMSIFTFCWTLLFFIYIFVTPLWFPKIYLYWAHLGLEILTTIFWLTSFALLAQEEQGWGAFNNAQNEINSALGDLGASDGSDIGINFDFIPKFKSANNATKGAEGLAAVNWILFIVTLVAFSYFLHQHRVAHGATGFGGFTHRSAPADVETAQVEKPNAPEQPVELTNVAQQPHTQAPVA